MTEFRRTGHLHVNLAVGLALVVGCGSRTALTTNQIADSGNTSVDAHSDTATGCAVVPKSHRVNAVSCPVARAPGNATMLDVDASSVCKQDSDCTMGKNGRCILNEEEWGQPTCSYDDCDSDSDCAGNVACVCRAAATDSTPNLCATSSGCRIDSDCGKCGYCSPSGNPFFPPALYFCHTVSDDCTDDSDCAQTPGSCQNGCNYDSQAGHWSCGSECPP